MCASQPRKLLFGFSFLLSILAASASAWARAATLGRGLEQLVQLYESGNPKLGGVDK